MKVLVVLSVSPYPKDVGKRIMVGGICDYLKQSPNVDAICVASFVGDGPGTGMDHVVALPPPSARRKIVNALWYSVLLRSKSLQESFFWNPAAEQKLEQLLDEFQPDVIIYDTLRTGQYGRGREQRGSRMEVIYMDDLFSVRYAKMLEAIKQQRLEGIDAIGNFGDNIPGTLLKIYQKYPALQKLLLRIERRLIAASENRAPGRFDRALLVSSVEQAILRDRTKADNVFSIPPRLDSYELARRAWNGSPEFVFLGSLNLAHNTISLETFLQQNIETLLQQIPDIRIAILGKGAGPNLRSLAALYPRHIVLHGFVQDLDEILLRACAMISPLTFGSGVKLKAIDSLRCGVPLVTTSHGVEGIEVGESRGVLKDEVRNFPAAMRSLLDPTLNAIASRENAELYRRFYSSSAVDQVYRRVLLDSRLSLSSNNRLESAAS
jgi:glycosyltransferase involved in cell wall biosynthesis